VQVGNEINVGMLFPLGGVYGYGNNSWASLAGLINSGYAAVKAVFPGALVIVHLSSGENDSIFESFFDSLKAAGGKFDVIGMSAYPYWSGLPWATEVTDVTATMKDMTSRYGVPTMVCECGYLESDPSDCSSYLNALIAAAKQAGALGVFYWEPECYGSWPTAASGGTYTLGAFTAGGMPSAGMNAFADSGVAPYFTGQPTPQTIATGSSVVFNAPASAFPSPTFQWYLNGTLIAGATGPTLLITGAAAANAGNYTCVATNSAGSVTSACRDARRGQHGEPRPPGEHLLPRDGRDGRQHPDRRLCRGRGGDLGLGAAPDPGLGPGAGSLWGHRHAARPAAAALLGLHRARKQRRLGRKRRDHERRLRGGRVRLEQPHEPRRGAAGQPLRGRLHRPDRRRKRRHRGRARRGLRRHGGLHGASPRIVNISARVQVGTGATS
jgi:hypothetical protein